MPSATWWFVIIRPFGDTNDDEPPPPPSLPYLIDDIRTWSIHSLVGSKPYTFLSCSSGRLSNVHIPSSGLHGAGSHVAGAGFVVFAGVSGRVGAKYAAARTITIARICFTEDDTISRLTF